MTHFKTALLQCAILLFFENANAFIIPSTDRTKDIRLYPGGIFCGPSEVAGKQEKVYFSGQNQQSSTPFCEGKKLKLKPTILFELSYPSLAGMPIDKAGELKERLVLGIEGSLKKVYSFGSERPHVTRPDFVNCLSSGGSESLYVLSDFQVGFSEGSVVEAFVEPTKSADSTLSATIRVGNWKIKHLKEVTSEPRVWTISSLTSQTEVPLTSALGNYLFAKKETDSGTAYTPAVLEDLAFLIEKFVVVTSETLSPSALLENSSAVWKEILAKNTKVTKQLIPNGARFMVTLDLEDVCEKLVSRDDLVEK